MVHDRGAQQRAHRQSEELARFSAGALPPRRMRRVQRLLASCPQCRQELEELANVQALMRRAPDPLPPRSFTLTREALRQQRRTLFYPLLRAATTAAATIVLVVLLAGLLDPALLGPVPAPRRAVESKPTPLHPATPLPVAVEPACTSRPRPTLNAAPQATAVPTAVLAGAGPGAAYPEPTAAAPRIQGTVARPATEPTTPSSGLPAAQGLWQFLHLGALALLALLAGLTWLAYRRERAFFA